MVYPAAAITAIMRLAQGPRRKILPTRVAAMAVDQRFASVQPASSQRNQSTHSNTPARAHVTPALSTLPAPAAAALQTPPRNIPAAGLTGKAVNDAQSPAASLERLLSGGAVAGRSLAQSSVTGGQPVNRAELRVTAMRQPQWPPPEARSLYAGRPRVDPGSSQAASPMEGQTGTQMASRPDVSNSTCSSSAAQRTSAQETALSGMHASVTTRVGFGVSLQTGDGASCQHPDVSHDNNHLRTSAVTCTSSTGAAAGTTKGSSSEPAPALESSEPARVSISAGQAANHRATDFKTKLDAPLAEASADADDAHVGRDHAYSTASLSKRSERLARLHAALIARSSAVAVSAELAVLIHLMALQHGSGTDAGPRVESKTSHANEQPLVTLRSAAPYACAVLQASGAHNASVRCIAGFPRHFMPWP